MRSPGLLLAGFLSFLPFVAALASGGSLRIEGATWTALALLPWIALAGLPRGKGAAAEPRSSWLLPVALALPALGLGIGADGLSRVEVARTVVAGAGGLGLVLLWSGAARLGAGEGRRGTAYGLFWLLLVPGASAAIWALSWAPGGSSGTWLQALDLALPLPWLASAAERGEVGVVRLLVGLLGNVGVVLAVCGLVRACAGPPAEEQA